MCIPVHSPWQPGDIVVAQTVLIILTMAGLSPDRPRRGPYILHSSVKPLQKEWIRCNPACRTHKTASNPTAEPQYIQSSLQDFHNHGFLLVTASKYADSVVFTQSRNSRLFFIIHICMHICLRHLCVKETFLKTWGAQLQSTGLTPQPHRELHTKPACPEMSLQPRYHQRLYPGPVPCMAAWSTLTLLLCSLLPLLLPSRSRNEHLALSQVGDFSHFLTLLTCQPTPACSESHLEPQHLLMLFATSSSFLSGRLLVPAAKVIFTAVTECPHESREARRVK